jgi:hypothetical protein
VPPEFLFLQWPERQLAQLVLRPAEVAYRGLPVSFRFAYLTPRIAVSMLGAWVMTFAAASPFPRRTTRPDGSQGLELAGADTPILLPQQVEALLGSTLTRAQHEQLDRPAAFLWDRVELTAELVLTLRDGITSAGRAVPRAGQPQAAQLAGLGARLRPGLARLLLAEVLAADPATAPQLADRAATLYAQTVRSIVESTAPAGTYTLGHLARYNGGQGKAAALRSVVGFDADLAGRFQAVGPLPLPRVPDEEDEPDSDDDGSGVISLQMADLKMRVDDVHQSYGLLLQEAHDAHAVATGLRADLGARLAAIEARLPAGTGGLSGMDDHAALTMLVWRIRDEAAAASQRASTSPP